MHARPLLLAATLVAALLVSGCAGPDATTTAASPSACLVQSATDKTCDQAARNATGVAAPHLHDYWGGADQKVLTDVSTSVGPVLCSESASIALLRPKDGETVFQGTSQVDAKLTWDAPLAADAAGPTEVWVKSAADHEAKSLGAATSGQEFVLPSTNDANDLPHQVLSAWEFHLIMKPANPSGCFSYHGSVTLHVVLHRGLPIPLYPGHPDRWNGQDKVMLVEAQRDVTFYAGGTVGGMCLSTDCLWAPHIPKPGTVVPYDAQTVTVTITQPAAAPGAPAPVRLRFGYHGADTRTLSYPTPTIEDGTTRTYVILVGTAGDGPYAQQSQWEFWLEPEPPANVFSGAYTITAIAQQGTGGM